MMFGGFFPCCVMADLWQLQSTSASSRDECASTPCQHGGTCLDQSNSFFCSCPGGWSGVKCQTNINECSSLPCANGGTCMDQTNSFFCTCTSGYSGVRCLANVDECASAPCTSGLLCVDG